MGRTNIDWMRLACDMKAGETRALNRFASIVLGAMRRNVRTRKRSPKASEYPTQRPSSHWSKSFRYEQATPATLEAVVGATTDKNSTAQKTLEHGGQVVWTYARLLSGQSKSAEKRFFAVNNLENKSTAERRAFLTREHRAHMQRPFASKTLAEMQSKFLPSFKDIL